MILIILFVGILIFIMGSLMLPNLFLRIFVGALGFIVAVGAAVLLIGNDNHHWGMVQATTTRTVNIGPVAPNKDLEVLLYEPLKQSKTERVYAYKQMGAADKSTTSASLKTTNHVVKRDTDSAVLVTKTTVWKYKDQMWHRLFALTGKHHELVKEVNTFELPNDWEVLSTRQAKWLESAAKQQQKSLKKALPGVVQKIIKKQKAANPHLTAAQLKIVTQKAEAAVAKQAKAQAPKTRADLIKRAKEQPEE